MALTLPLLLDYTLHNDLGTEGNTIFGLYIKRYIAHGLNYIVPSIGSRAGITDTTVTSEASEDTGLPLSAKLPLVAYCNMASI